MKFDELLYFYAFLQCDSEDSNTNKMRNDLKSRLSQLSSSSNKYYNPWV
jgi:hypothetical protein